MKKIYVVMDAFYEAETEVVQAFEDVDEAVLFCREKNYHTCHTFFIQEIELKEKEI